MEESRDIQALKAIFLIMYVGLVIELSKDLSVGLSFYILLNTVSHGFIAAQLHQD
jgi:hypothetical protein